MRTEQPGSQGITTAVEWLGVIPRNEPPAAAPTADAAFRLALLYRVAVRRALGDEPDGATLRVLRPPPGRPAPFELACVYDPADPQAAEYADFCRTAAPPTWAAAGMIPPIAACLGCGPRGR